MSPSMAFITCIWQEEKRVGNCVRGLNQRISQLSISSIYDYFLFLIILTSPILVYGFLIFSFNMRLSRFFLILIFPFLFLRVMQRPQLILRDKLFVFVILPYLIYTTASLLWTSAFSVMGGVQRLGGLYEVMVIYILLIVADLDSKRFIKFVKCYLLSAVIPLGVAMWQLANNFLHFSQSEVPFTKFLITGKYPDILVRGYLEIGGGFSRLSATFAEPTIFGCFMCSVLLLSMMLEFQSKFYRFFLRLFQWVGVVVMVLSFTKLAIICFAVGVLVLARSNRKYLLALVVFVSIIVLIALVMYLSNMFFLTDRLLRETGHYRLLMESIEELKKINLFIGAGIGSIPGGSWHRFLISRVYESGIVGFIFVLFISFIPFKLALLKISDDRVSSIRYIAVATITATLVGLHLYDFFIHLFPWLVIGLTVSFYNHCRSVVGRTSGPGSAMVVSLNFHPGHFSHLVANYKLFEDLGFTSYLYVNKTFNQMDEMNEFKKLNTPKDLAKLKNINVAVFWFPSLKNIVEIIRLRLLFKTQILYVYHEPFDSIKNYYNSGFRFKKILKICLINLVNIPVLFLSHKIILPSASSLALYEKKYTKLNRNYANISLLFDDEANLSDLPAKKYISYIGTVAADHAFDRYVEFVAAAVKNSWLSEMTFLIATSSAIPDAQKEILNPLMHTGRVVISAGRSMKNSEINLYYKESQVVWNAYNRSMQSGVLPKAFMFGSAVLTLQCNVNEFLDNYSTCVLISDNRNIDEIKMAVEEILSKKEFYFQNCRNKFFEKFYYKNQTGEFMSLLNNRGIREDCEKSFN